jgi:hypothetical protein
MHFSSFVLLSLMSDRMADSGKPEYTTEDLVQRAQRAVNTLEPQLAAK